MQSSRIHLLNARFRLLRSDDALDILEWRNHPDIYRFTASGSPINLESHRRWVSTRLHNLAEEPIYILENCSKLGMFRVDNKSNSLNAREISILVSPNNLGSGIGSHMMNLYFSEYVSDSKYKYFARIHQDNIKSQRFFEKHNFFKFNKTNQFLLFQRKV